MVKTIMIIGNGIAGLSAAEQIRLKDKVSRIIMIGQEPFHTYNRLELSKRITEEYPAESIFIKSEDWYEEQNIECHLGDPVVDVDLVNKSITTKDGQMFSYTHLLLANGGSSFTPPIPGIHLENVFSLRTLQDARQIQEVASRSQRILLIGGGLLGLEMAWKFQQAGMTVTIVEMFPQLMPRQLDLDSARYLEDVIREHGVELILDRQVSQIVGEDCVTGFQLNHEAEIRPIDVCIYSTGMRSNVGLYQETGLEIHHGVVVDNGMRTNIENVYAAGDICEYDGRVYGLWSAARMQGAVAGQNIVGEETTFESASPVTNIHVFNQVITSLGEVQPDSVVEFRNERSTKSVLKKLLFKEDVLCGGIFVNDQKEVIPVRRGIERKVVVPPKHRGSFEEIVQYLQHNTK